MDRQSERCPCCFVHGFAKGRMRVDGSLDFFERRFKVHGESELYNKLCRFRAYDVRTEDFSVGYANDEFDVSFRFANRKGLSICRKRKLADLEFQAQLFCRTFCESDASHLWLAIG